MPVVTYVDPDSVSNPTTGASAPATWFTTHEANFRSIVGRVGASLSGQTAQSLTAGGTTTITLGTTDWNNGMTVGSNAITVPSSYGGKYIIAADLDLAWTTGVGSSITVKVLVNGTAVHNEVYAQSIGIPGGGNMAVSCAFLYALAVSDAVTLSVTGATMSTITTQVGSIYSRLSAIWLSA